MIRIIHSKIITTLYNSWTPLCKTIIHMGIGTSLQGYFSTGIMLTDNSTNKCSDLCVITWTKMLLIYFPDWYFIT